MADPKNSSQRDQQTFLTLARDALTNDDKELFRALDTMRCVARSRKRMNLVTAQDVLSSALRKWAKSAKPNDLVNHPVLKVARKNAVEAVVSACRSEHASHWVWVGVLCSIASSYFPAITPDMPNALGEAISFNVQLMKRGIVNLADRFTIHRSPAQSVPERVQVFMAPEKPLIVEEPETEEV